jgi:hypothetical protein
MHIDIMMTVSMGVMRKGGVMARVIIALAISFMILSVGHASGEETKPLQLAIFDPIQLVPAGDSIQGLRLSAFYTVNKDVSGLSLVWLGVNRATGDVSGIEIGLGNWVEKAAYGLQMGIVNHAGNRCVGLQYGMANVVEGDMSGLQWGLVNWTEGFIHGMQAGVVNVSKGRSAGLDLGVVNYNDGSFEGVQGGFVNYAGCMRGLQLGIVNYAKSLDGVQVGLGNYNGDKCPMEFMVLVNWSFG